MKVIIAICLIALTFAASQPAKNATQVIDTKALEAQLTKKITLQVKLQAAQEREGELIREITEDVLKLNKEQSRLKKAQETLKKLTAKPAAPKPTPKPVAKPTPVKVNTTNTTKANTTNTTKANTTNTTKTNTTAIAVNATKATAKTEVVVKQAQAAIANATKHNTTATKPVKPIVDAKQKEIAAALKAAQLKKLRLEHQKRAEEKKKAELEKQKKREAEIVKKTNAISKAEYGVKDATEDVKDAQKELNKDINELLYVQGKIGGYKAELKKIASSPALVSK